MPPVPPLSFPEAIYNQLPAKERKKLAHATGKQSAFSSASLLSNTLKNPAVVKALRKDSFGSYINKSGKIKWWTRLKLTLRHFFHALFSNYAKLSKDFAKLVERLCKGNTSKANGKGDATTRKEAASSGPGGNRGTLARDFALNMGAAAAGNVLGNQFHDWRKSKQVDQQVQTAGGDGGETTGEAPKAEIRGGEDHEVQDAHEVDSDSGSDVSEADDDDHSDAGSDHDHDDGGGNDGGDSGGGWFGWPWGGDGDGDGGGGD